MRGGYSQRNLTALQQVLELIPHGTSIATAADSAVIDRDDYGENELVNNLRCTLTLVYTTSGGAGGDEIDLTINVNQGDDSAGDDTVFATLTDSIVVDDDDDTATATYTFDLDLKQAQRYIMVDVLLAPGTGAPTISAASCAMTAVVMASNGVPVASYVKGALVQVAAT